MSGRFDGKVALIAGGGWPGREGSAMGIGSAIGQQLAAEGARVGVMDNEPTHADRTIAAIQGGGGEAIGILGDVKSDDDCKRAVDEVVAKHGRIDVLVNNVATGTPPPEIERDSIEAWDFIMDTNFRSYMIMSRYAAPHIPRGGSIVNIGSVFGTVDPIGTAGYTVSKRAVSLVATPTLAAQLGADGIRVNGVTIGYIWNTVTEQIRPGIKEGESVEDYRKARTETLGVIGVEGMPEDVAKAVAFLASDDARWITGQDLIVDGGYCVTSLFEMLFTRNFRGAG
jgi:NAD(P)-dependent dehydrogenase (short-subunit alcohol dehydrogenase family)